MVRIWSVEPRLEVTRTSFHLLQYIFQFRGCGHNLEVLATVMINLFFKLNLIYSSFSEGVVRIWRIWARLEVMRTSVNIIQYIFLFKGCDQNLVEMAKVGGHEDIC